MKKKKVFNLTSLLNQQYTYGFKTEIEKEIFTPGINNKIIKALCKKRKDPFFLQYFRLKAYNIWKKMIFPLWSKLKFPKINFKALTYYSIPKKKVKFSKVLDQKLLKTFEKLGISLYEHHQLANIAIDAVFDSLSIVTTYQEKLAKEGIIFSSISLALKNYPQLIKKYLGSVVSINDNFFAALNSCVFSDGSFCFIPKNTVCPIELSSYFRINDKNAGQFERTLIIAETNSLVSYLEGCTAPKFNENQLHAAIVELIAFENAKIKYSTIQNWYSGNESGKGGIYNFVTKRGLCFGKTSKISWTQIETGSSVTWKYPSCILFGNNSIGEFYSVALTNYFQQADTGTKMVHLGYNTKSRIISKGISAKNSKNTYRGLVKIGRKAHFAQNFSQCDSFLIGSTSTASTYPYLDIKNSTAKIEHEAKISKISEEQFFYLLQRGINHEKAIMLLINGFCKDVITMLPLEFSLEAEKLLSLKLERSIG